MNQILCIYNKINIIDLYFIFWRCDMYPLTQNELILFENSTFP